MYIKVMGRQRTGTTYLEELIKLNTDAINLNNKWGWKHASAYEFGREEESECYNCKAIIVIKNPYTWFSSIKRWADKNNKWLIKDKSKNNYVNFTIKSAYERYNFLYHEHKKLLEGNYNNTIFDDSILIRYEDYLLDQNHEMQRIGEKFGLKINFPLIEPIKVECSPELFTEEKKRFYLEQKPEEFEKEITNAVDWDLMSFYGYKKIIKEAI